MELKPGQNIEELFREGFSDFEPEVDASVWNKIEMKLQASNSAQTTKKVSGKSGFKTILITAAITTAATALVTTGILTNGFGLLNKNKVETPVVSENPVVINEKTTNKENINATPTLNKSTKLEPVVSTNKNETEKQATQNIVNNEPVISNEKTITPIEEPVKKPNSFDTPINPGMNRKNISEKPVQVKKDNKANEVTNESNNPDITGPIASIWVSETSGTVPLKVSFNNKGNSIFNDWNFGDGSMSSLEQDPTHTFEKAGTYWVKLKGINENNVKAYDSVKIVVKEETNRALIPNSFTPNGDAINDVFKIVSSFEVVQLSIIITSTNGQQVASFNSIDDGWDGRDMKTGLKCNDGIYLYLAKIKYADGFEEVKKGFIKLIQ